LLLLSILSIAFGVLRIVKQQLEHEIVYITGVKMARRKSEKEKPPREYGGCPCPESGESGVSDDTTSLGSLR
jgi:hypothetical protein